MSSTGGVEADSSPPNAGGSLYARLLETARATCGEHLAGRKDLDLSAVAWTDDLERSVRELSETIEYDVLLPSLRTASSIPEASLSIQVNVLSVLKIDTRL